MATAKLVFNSIAGVIDAVIFTNDSGQKFGIPFDPANTDAAEFAKWLQDGNIPEAAEEGGVVTDEWVAETIAKLLPNG
jgi:hypothetical protein